MGVSTIVCWRLHVRLVQQGKIPTFGVVSCLCCFFCTCFSICLPIDEMLPDPVGQPVEIITYTQPGLFLGPSPQGQVVGASQPGVVRAQVVQGHAPSACGNATQAFQGQVVQGQVVQGTVVR